jgi:hypothetical protein
MVSNTNDNRNMISLAAIIIQAAEHIAAPKLRKDLRITNEQAVAEAIELVSEASRQLRRGEEEWYDALQLADNAVDQLKTTEKLLRAELKLANDQLRIMKERENYEEPEVQGKDIFIEGERFHTSKTPTLIYITHSYSSLMGSGVDFNSALADLMYEIIDLYDDFVVNGRYRFEDGAFGDLLRWVKEIRPQIKLPTVRDPFNDDEDFTL